MSEGPQALPGQSPGNWSANISQTGSIKLVLTWDGATVGELFFKEGKQQFTGDPALSTKVIHQLLHHLLKP